MMNRRTGTALDVAFAAVAVVDDITDDGATFALSVVGTALDAVVVVVDALTVADAVDALLLLALL